MTKNTLIIHTVTKKIGEVLGEINVRVMYFGVY